MELLWNGVLGALAARFHYCGTAGSSASARKVPTIELWPPSICLSDESCPLSEETIVLSMGFHVRYVLDCQDGGEQKGNLSLHFSAGASKGLYVTADSPGLSLE